MTKQPTVRRPIAILLASLTLTAATSALAADPSGGDAARGQRLFLQCRACHVVAEGAPPSVGPNLYGVVGAKAGQRPGYAYSSGLAASGIVWDRETLDKWLTKPTALVPGTKMAFQGVASPTARQDLIAYFYSLKANHP